LVFRDAGLQEGPSTEDVMEIEADCSDDSSDL